MALHGFLQHFLSVGLQLGVLYLGLLYVVVYLSVFHQRDDLVELVVKTAFSVELIKGVFLLLASLVSCCLCLRDSHWCYVCIEGRLEVV